MTKTTKKQTTKKEQSKQKTFLELIKDGKSTAEALAQTKAARTLLLQKNFYAGDYAETISALANKYGYSKKKYEYLASYPLKSDIAKIETIAPFKDKQRETLTPRMAAALVIAYLNRETDAGFSRIFPNGLFLENGCLTDLLTAGYITSEKGTAEKQAFIFNLKKIGGLFNNPTLKELEKKMAQADII